MRTLLDQWPEPRSTNDLDLFLRPELLIESSKLKPLVSAIAELGYQVVPGAEKYPFAKPGTGGTGVGGVKIDILFRDRLDDPNKEFGRYHALEILEVSPQSSKGLSLNFQQW